MPPTIASLKADVRAEWKRRPGVVVLVTAGAGIVAAYAAVKGLHGRIGSAATTPAGVSSLTDPFADPLGLGGGLPPFSPAAPAQPTGGAGGASGGGFDPIFLPPTIIGKAPTSAPLPKSSPKPTLGGIPSPGGSSGPVAVTSRGSSIPSSIATVPTAHHPGGAGTPTRTSGGQAGVTNVVDPFTGAVATIVSYGGWGSAAGELKHHRAVPARTAPSHVDVSYGGWGSAAAQRAHHHRARPHSHSAHAHYVAPRKDRPHSAVAAGITQKATRA